MEHLSLQEIIVFLVAAGLIVPTFKTLKISPVLGFIIVGIFVGPHGLTTLLPDNAWTQYVLITDKEGVTALAELGVIFLLVMIGLDLSTDRLWAMRKLVLGMGNIQILATTAVIGAIAYAWGNSIEAAIILGGCLALSSTAIVLQLLVDQGRFGSPAGHASFSILLAQDLAVVPLLFLVASFGEASSGSMGSNLAFAIGEALITILAIFFVGRAVLRPLFRFVGRLDSPELFMATTLLVVIGAASISHAAGLSAALGAFLAGLLLAESEYRHDIEFYLEPFKGLLLGLFFMSVAMEIDINEVARNPVWIVLSVIGLFTIKAVITTATAKLFGFSWAHASETGIVLAQGGEFAFVVLGLALSFALLPAVTTQFMLIVVSATMFITPFLANLSRVVGAKLDQNAESPVSEFNEELANHIVLVGYGRTGKLLSKMLNANKTPYIVIDRDSGSADKDVVQIGDATRSTILTKFGIAQAQALVICINQPDTVSHIIDATQRLAPKIPILVRAHDEHQARAYLALGATVAVPEVLESGLQLAQALLTQIDIPDHASGEIVAQLRQQAHANIN